MKLATLAVTPLLVATGAAAAPATYLLDGIWGYHHRWEALRSRVEREVGPAKIWRYDNTGRVSLEVLGAEFAAELKRVQGPVNLIGYSMGGLVVREALRQAPELRVHRVVLLHSPHKGSLNSLLLPMLPACREMQPGSAFLRRLDQAPWNHPTLVTWCPWDLMVFPGSSARWEKASVRLRCDMPMHNWPILSRSLHRTITGFLVADPPEAALPRPPRERSRR
jgi:Predicted acetyltransferases and hydrolases with the alpha/beta hydrolase fold